MLPQADLLADLCCRPLLPRLWLRADFPAAVGHADVEPLLHVHGGAGAHAHCLREPLGLSGPRSIPLRLQATLMGLSCHGAVQGTFQHFSETVAGLAFAQVIDLRWEVPCYLGAPSKGAQKPQFFSSCAVPLEYKSLMQRLEKNTSFWCSLPPCQTKAKVPASYEPEV